MGVPMINWDAHTIAGLQQAKALLQQLQSLDVHTVALAAELVEGELSRRAQAASAPVAAKAAAPPACPSPGCTGVLRHCPSSSALAGATVLVCSRGCGYSRVEGGV